LKKDKKRKGAKIPQYAGVKNSLETLDAVVENDKSILSDSWGYFR
jgi:hypothetical protein